MPIAFRIAASTIVILAAIVLARCRVNPDSAIKDAGADSGLAALDGGRGDASGDDELSTCMDGGLAFEVGAISSLSYREFAPDGGEVSAPAATRSLTLTGITPLFAERERSNVSLLEVRADDGARGELYVELQKPRRITSFPSSFQYSRTDGFESCGATDSRPHVEHIFRDETGRTRLWIASSLPLKSAGDVRSTSMSPSLAWSDCGARTVEHSPGKASKSVELLVHDEAQEMSVRPGHVAVLPVSGGSLAFEAYSIAITADETCGVATFIAYDPGVVTLE